MSFNLKRCVIGILLCLIASLMINTKCLAFDKRFSVSLSHFIMASMYDQLGETEQSVQEYKKSLSVDYKNSFTHLNLAIAYLKKKDIPRAVYELNLSIKLDPEATEPHMLLALLYFSQGNNGLATTEYENALKSASKLEPKNIDLYKSLALVYLHQKKLKDAEIVYKLIIDLAPADSESHYYLASIYDEQKNRAAAIEELRKSLELKPDYADALNYLGYVYVEENRELDKAELLIKKALEIEPDNGAYVDSLGWLYFKKGKIQEAVRELKKAATLLEDPVIFDHLGDAYYKIKDLDNAKLSWEKSLKIDPSQDKIKEKINSFGKEEKKAKK